MGSPDDSMSSSIKSSKFSPAVSLLTSWHLSTAVHITTESSRVVEGENILLLVHDLPDNTKSLVWFKALRNATEEIAAYALPYNLSRPGPLYSGRETIYRNGSLMIENVNLKDAGFYILQTYNRRKKVISTTTMYLQVNAFHWNCGRLATSGQPTIESVPSSVVEGGSVLLIVRNPPENIIAFAWFKGMVVFKSQEVARYIIEKKSTVWGPAHSGKETLYRDGSLLLHGVTQKDSGFYTLAILRTDMRSEEAHVHLQVDPSHSLCCNPLTPFPLMIQPLPPYAVEGNDVLLYVHNLPEDLQGFAWYKSIYRGHVIKIVEYSSAMYSLSWEPEYKPRGTMYKDGSLMLLNVTEEDAGMYALAILNKDFKIEEAYVKFHIYKNVTQPFVQISDTTVTGQRSVIFSCISPDTNISIRWIFNKKNLQLKERMTLSPTKCGLKIDPVKSEDAGEYQCEVFNQVSSKISPPVSLAVMNE
ncbi:pregnancy-specific glycoprotein 22-like [Microtus oregoni]|uniref:pregnancy-specific glycoprotein 22-like n=1 Tax=Microtus oregoni TaxID=111838 RepID=UPI001BB13BEC|nr:pregnancy-specific glycoprotein 22-like [Microtus oregoni]